MTSTPRSMWGRRRGLAGRRSAPGCTATRTPTGRGPSARESGSAASGWMPPSRPRAATWKRSAASSYRLRSRSTRRDIVRRWILPVLVLPALLGGCGDRNLILTVDILSFLDPAARSTSYGPIPAGIPATSVDVVNDSLNLLQGLHDVTKVVSASLRIGRASCRERSVDLGGRR